MIGRIYDSQGYEGSNGGTVQGGSSRTLEPAYPSAATTSVVPDSGPVSSTDRERMLQSRTAQGWGPAYVPPAELGDERQLYRRICDDLSGEIGELDNHLVDGRIDEEGAGVMAEIQYHLERLYDCPFGQGESLKTIVVAIQSQISNAQWTASHVAFLRAAISFLRPRWLINDQMADEIDGMIEEYDLHVFRGTVSEPDVVTQYRVVEVPHS